MFTYYGMGLNVFIETLKQDLSSRVDEFHKDMMVIARKDPYAFASKKRTKWFRLYKKWAKQKEIEQLCKEYVTKPE